LKGNRRFAELKPIGKKRAVDYYDRAGATAAKNQIQESAMAKAKKSLKKAKKLESTKPLMARF